MRCFQFFCRLGFPAEVLSDNGSQFTSDMFKQFLRLLSIKGVHSSPYHAQSNGIVERFHGTLKPMLKKMILKNPKQWHRQVPPLLFAVRELPNVSTGFSPFELLFGRRARGPIDFLADNWMEGANAEEAKNVCEYVYELRNNIVEMCELAHDSVIQAGKEQKKYKDRKAKNRSFQVNEEVLVFLPTTANKLLMTWKGPYKIVEVLDFDYVIDMGGKKKIFHANMLKLFHRRQDAAVTSFVAGETVPFQEILPCSYRCLAQEAEQQSTTSVNGLCIKPDVVFSAVGVLPAEDDDPDLSPLPIPTLDTPGTETFEDIKYSDKLSEKQNIEMHEVFREQAEILTTNPGCCTMELVHHINLTTDQPVFKKQYPLPFSSQETIKEEVQYMLDLGVIEPSKSSFSAPVVLVKKPDGSTRFCCDFF